VGPDRPTDPPTVADGRHHPERQPMTADSLPRAAAADAVSRASADPDLQFVVCVVAAERYGIEVGHVHEIIRLPSITALPGSDRSFGGVINLRGRVIPVMDLRNQLGLDAAPPTRLSRIVVADAGDAQIGLVVDAVNEVVRIAASAIEPTPALTAGAADHLKGIARTSDGLIVILDLERLLGAAATDGGDDGAAARA
jgi:purine-binding chemotaxis protein CheW